MDLQLLIVEKLFTAFSGIVTELVKSSNFEEHTKTILNNNIASISSILFTISNKEVTGNITPSTNTPPKSSRQTRSKRLNTGVVQESNPKVIRKNNILPSCSGASTRQVVQCVDPKPVPVVDPVDLTAAEGTEDFELCAIAPEKKVLISNFPTTTTVADIVTHIKKKVPGNILITSFDVKKIEPKTERPITYSSFIINSYDNLEVFKLLVDSKLWPVHSVVHEFNTRRKTNFQYNRRRQRRT